MASSGSVVIKGFPALFRAFAMMDADFRTASKKALKNIGEIVRADAANRFRDYDARSAAGFRVISGEHGVLVRQMIKTSTGQHPEYGALQMKKALLPALAAKQGEVEAAFLVMIERITRTQFPL